VLASPIGKFKIYQASGEPKCPFILYKDLPTEQDEEDWSQYIQKLEDFPYFPNAGMSIHGRYLYFATKSRQLFKIKHISDKFDEIGKFSFLTGPMHSAQVTGV
jgi:hypothetical protein